MTLLAQLGLPFKFLSWQTAALASAAAIPALLLLYFLKLRRRERKISSTLLWKKAVQDLQVNAPFQRLRKNLLLFLQLLILAAVLFGLGNPVAHFVKQSERNVVVLIDQSGSMNAIEADGRMRLEHAKDGAVDFVENLREGARAMVIAFADRANVVCSFTDDKRRLRRMIEGIEPTDGPSLIGEALQLAEAYSTKLVSPTGEGWLPDSTEMADIELFSDGQIADANEGYISRGEMTYYRVGRVADNAGIVAFDVRRDLERPGIISVFAQVQNFGALPIQSDVSISLDGRMLSVEGVSLGADPRTTTRPSSAAGALPSGRNVIFELEHRAGGVIEVKLHRADAFEQDNVVRAPVEPPRAIRVLAVSNRREVRFLLKRAFQTALDIGDFTLMSASEYESAKEGDLALDGRSVFDLVVVDKHDTDRLSPGNYLFFGGLPKIEGVSREGSVDEQVFVTWREIHPLMRHVMLENVFTLQWDRLTLPSHAVKLIEGENSAAMAFIADPGHRYVLVAFDLLDSDFRMKPAFIIFLQNVVLYLATGGMTDSGRLVRPGEPLLIPVPPGADEVRITRPDGSLEDIDVTDRVSASYTRTRQCGVYKATFDDPNATVETYAANVLNPSESAIAPNAAFSIGTEQVQTVAGEVKVNQPLWPYAVALALAVMLLEWWIYNRRVMI